ncbi:hypothetical protein Poly51_14700 [Rubripirellula tenax]|uniref:Uncharacterized protein n=1 Tax=Rubripirellula tenax TaxID=2528015 RepID=A0A5C6FGF6_9BACT|nr:hypothetical protein [Rubripirellula tenax]TWU58691.1 hypothetical protein Poly51_14700 [Rubripirellula tenax]
MYRLNSEHDVQHRRPSRTTKRHTLGAVIAAGMSCVAIMPCDAENVRLVTPSTARLMPPTSVTAPPTARVEAVAPAPPPVRSTLTLESAPVARIASAPTDRTADSNAAPPSSIAKDGEMSLEAPSNSTLELRVARRPWLLEKLINPGGSDSQSMDPPKPPTELPDPPSLGRMPTKPRLDNQSIDLGDDDGWNRRGQMPAPRLNAVIEEPSLKLVQPREAAPITQPRQVPRLQPEPTAQPSVKPNRLGAPDQSESARIPETHRPTTQPRTPQTRTPLNVASDGPIPLTDPPAMRTRNSRPAPTTKSRSISSDAQGDNEGPSPAFVGDVDPLSDDGGVTVRKLKIARDGTPVDDSGRIPPESTSLAAPAKRSVSDLPEYVKAAKPLREVEVEARSVAPESKSEPVDEIDSMDLNSASRSKAVAPREARQPIDYAGFPQSEVPVSNTVGRLQGVMRSCLAYYHNKAEIANERSNWGMMHAIMVYGIDTQVKVDNRSYSTIAWIAGNNACRGQRLLTTKNDRIVAKSGVGLQGHQGQMLAVFSLCDVPTDYPLYADGKKFALSDVIREEQLACKSGEELTFTLIGLSHYMDTDATWKAEDGSPWDFERLIREELAQPIVGAACGGTHRLMGFAHALRKRRAEGKPIDGQWKRAETFTEDFIDYAYRLQNRDGSMSTDWFEGRENDDDMDRKVQTTGHIVEWLLTVTPDSQLQNPRLVAAIRYLLTSMHSERDHDWSIGPKGHALRSLAMYYDRVYRPDTPPWRTPMTARSAGNSRR